MAVLVVVLVASGAWVFLTGVVGSCVYSLADHDDLRAVALSYGFPALFVGLIVAGLAINVLGPYV